MIPIGGLHSVVNRLKTLTITRTYSASCIKIGKEQVTQKILLRDSADGPGFRVIA